jgi:hypothetical protein
MFFVIEREATRKQFFARPLIELYLSSTSEKYSNKGEVLV